MRVIEGFVYSLSALRCTAVVLVVYMYVETKKENTGRVFRLFAHAVQVKYEGFFFGSKLLNWAGHRSSADCSLSLLV